MSGEMRRDCSGTEGTRCERHVVRAGLQHRTDVLLARERESFDAMVTRLFTLDKGEITPPPLTAEALERALVSDQPGRAYAAAFLIGRCRAKDPEVDTALTRRLEAIVDGPSDSDVAVEAAMSLALRGDVARGRRALRAMLTSPDPLGDPYKAAFYLAQMGDPSGYGALVETLHSDIPHYRLMALRHVIAFAPYEGQEVEGATVDVRQLLVDRLADPDEMVRREVPFYLQELQVDDLRALLEPLAETDPSPSVRAAAQIVLGRTP